jgi:allantoicase
VDTDLASRWLGGSVVAASDESFGEKENLLNPGPADFQPGHYGHRGEIVDGWETRRRRQAGHDWALIRLATPGTVTSVDVDTRIPPRHGSRSSLARHFEAICTTPSRCRTPGDPPTSACRPCLTAALPDSASSVASFPIPASSTG